MSTTDTAAGRYRIAEIAGLEVEVTAPADGQDPLDTLSGENA